MRISISGISASCPGCGADDFIPADTSSPGRRDVFNCAKCNAEVRYGELIRRISDESKRRAKGEGGAGAGLKKSRPAQLRDVRAAHAAREPGVRGTDFSATIIGQSFWSVNEGAVATNVGTVLALFNELNSPRLAASSGPAPRTRGLGRSGAGEGERPCRHRSGRETPRPHRRR